MTSHRSTRRPSRHEKKGGSKFGIILLLLFVLTIWIFSSDLIDTSVDRFMSMAPVTSNQPKDRKVFFEPPFIYGGKTENCDLQYIASTSTEDNTKLIQTKLQPNIDHDGQRISFQQGDCDFNLTFENDQIPMWTEYLGNLLNWTKSCDSVYFVVGKINTLEMPNYIYSVNLCHNERPRAIAFVFPRTKLEKPLFEYSTTVDSVEAWTNEDFFADILSKESSIFLEKELNRLAWDYDPQLYKQRILDNKKLK